MNKNELREYCVPLMQLNNIDDCLRLLERYENAFLVITHKHHYDEVKTQALADAKIIFEMFLTKMLSIGKLLEGIGHKGDSIKLNNIIDPTMVFTLTRNIYESLSAFELIYLIPDTDEKKTILYHLFKLSGLKYNQRFNNGNIDLAMQKVYANELVQMDESLYIIKNISLYKSLIRKEKGKLDGCINKNDFKVRIDSHNKVEILSWQAVAKYFGLTMSKFNNIYTLFSLNAHPSHVSVMQFHDIFAKNNPEYIKLVLKCMECCFTLLSIFIADYLKIFPKVKDTYLKFSVEDQILLNHHNKLARGEAYSICDVWRRLED